MTEELESLKKVTERMQNEGFEYFLTGSMAMIFYSVPRMTRDADIVIQLYAKDIGKFVKLLTEDFFIDEGMVKDSFEKRMMFNIFDQKSFFKIDFIFKSNEPYEANVFERKKKMKINNAEINVISIEDLIISKLNWARDSYSELQLNDIRQLMKNNYDKKYVDNWVSKLNLNNIYEKI